MPSSFSKSSFARTGTKTQINRVSFNQTTTETPFDKLETIQDRMNIDHFSPIKSPHRRKRKAKTRKFQKKRANKTKKRNQKHQRKNIQQMTQYNVVKLRRNKHVD